MKHNITMESYTFRHSPFEFEMIWRDEQLGLGFNEALYPVNFFMVEMYKELLRVKRQRDVVADCATALLDALLPFSSVVEHISPETKSTQQFFAVNQIGGKAMTVGDLRRAKKALESVIETMEQIGE